jgi:hypothetical protein
MTDDSLTELVEIDRIEVHHLLEDVRDAVGQGRLESLAIPGDHESSANQRTPHRLPGTHLTSNTALQRRQWAMRESGGSVGGVGGSGGSGGGAGSSSVGGRWSIGKVVFSFIIGCFVVFMIKNITMKDYSSETKTYLTKIGRADAIDRVIPKTTAV